LPNNKLIYVNSLVKSPTLKEANETDYWIELLFQTNFLSEKEYAVIKDDSEELIKLLVTIVKTSKKNKANR
jgi:four helix bundle protein